MPTRPTSKTRSPRKAGGPAPRGKTASRGKPAARSKAAADGTFRKIALSLPGAVEAAHMSHPDFRVNNRVFATLGYPDNNWGMVKLTPEEQVEFVGEHPECFRLVTGAWGRQGATSVRLDTVDDETLGRAITSAWQNTARPKAKASGQKRPGR